MNFRQYASGGKHKYKRLTKVVRKLLRKEIRKQSCLRLVAIQSRAKDTKSIREHFSEEQLQSGLDIARDRKDLAGCRAIFYTNRDIRAFTSKAVLQGMFDIDWQRTKVHHPNLDDNAEDLFRSDNYVVKLKANQTNKPKYKELTGLWCEVQVQTVLNHAVSELSHDIIYKPKIEGEFGPQMLNEIREAVKVVDGGYIVPAGHMLSKIDSDFKRLREDKAVFDTNIITQISRAANQKDRLSSLESLREHVLPNFIDPLQEIPELLECLQHAWISADRSHTESCDYTASPNEDDILKDVLQAISAIYGEYLVFYPEQAYSILNHLYTNTRTDESHAELGDLADQLVRHDRWIWERYGSRMQVVYANKIYEDKHKHGISSIVIRIASKILGTEVDGVQRKINCIETSKASILYRGELAKARRKAIQCLINIHKESTESSTKKETQSVLLQGLAVPRIPGYDGAVIRMLINDFCFVLKNLSTPFDFDDCYALLRLERKIFFCWMSYRDTVGKLKANDKLEEATNRLSRKIENFSTLLNQNSGFVAYKLLIDSCPIFSFNWSTGKLELAENEKYRQNEQARLAEEIGSNYSDEWKIRLQTLISQISSDLARFQPLYEFFTVLGEKNPQILWEFLCKSDILPERAVSKFTVPLLRTDYEERVLGLMSQWAKDSKYCQEIAFTLHEYEGMDKCLVLSLLKSVSEQRDFETLSTLSSLSFRRFSEDKKFWKDELFVPALSFYICNGNFGWLDATSYLADGASMYDEFEDTEKNLALSALIRKPILCDDSMIILYALTSKEPERLLSFFRSRIQLSQELKGEGYEIVPDNIWRVQKVLRPHPKLLVTTILEWCKIYPHAQNDVVNGVLRKIYTIPTDNVVLVLKDTVATASKDTLLVIVNMLDGYLGDHRLLPVLRDMIASSNSDSEIENEVSGILYEFDGASEPIGVAKRFEEKIELLQEWRKDESKKVRDLALRLSKEFKNEAQLDRRHGEEEIAETQLEFGEFLNSPKIPEHKENEN